MTHGVFYAHVDSKEVLAAAAMEAAFADAERMFERAVEGGAPRDALAVYIKAYLSMAHRDGRDRGRPLPALVTDLPHMDGDVRDRYAARLLAPSRDALLARLPLGHRS